MTRYKSIWTPLEASFLQTFSEAELKRFPLNELNKLSSFSGVLYSSPEVTFKKNNCELWALNKSIVGVGWCSRDESKTSFFTENCCNMYRWSRYYLLSALMDSFSVIDPLSADKINLWGEGFREGYTRLGLLKPFWLQVQEPFSSQLQLQMKIRRFEIILHIMSKSGLLT